MAVNARTEEFQHIEVFDKPALFTNGRIARDTVPKGWYCYDIRGSDDDPGELCYMEENVVVNHAGSVLMPEKLAMPKSGRLDVRDELGFLDEGNMTLREFCEAHQFPYPAENMKFHIRPARPEEAGLFYTPHPEEDKRLGTVGHVRMDFGRSGNEFWHTWWPRGPEELNNPVFKAELQEVVDTLRESVLKSRFAMERFCYEHGGKISGGWTQNYGYRAAGMSDTAIQKMHDFDWEVFKQERIYRLHTQDLGIGIFDEPSAKQEDKSALMKKFLESVSRWDDYTTASRYGWIEEVDDPSIYKQLQALRKADLELLTLIVVDGLSQTEIAAVLGCSPQNIFGRLKKIRKIFQK